MKFELNRYLLEDIENREQPSEFIDTKEYSVLIVRLPYIKESCVDLVSYAYLIKDGEVFLYDREEKDFKKISFEKLHKMLDIQVDKII